MRITGKMQSIPKWQVIHKGRKSGKKWEEKQFHKIMTFQYLIDWTEQTFWWAQTHSNPKLTSQESHLTPSQHRLVSHCWIDWFSVLACGTLKMKLSIPGRCWSSSGNTRRGLSSTASSNTSFVWTPVERWAVSQAPSNCAAFWIRWCWI